jgi:hypothetical protein
VSGSQPWPRAAGHPRGGPQDAWYDEDAGPVVRLYAMTGGRTVTGRQDFALSTLVHGIPTAAPPAGLSPEQSRILRLSRRPVAVPEIAAHLGLPLGPVRVLLGDLRDAGLIAVPRPRDPTDDEPTQDILERVLSGLLAM